MEQTSINLLNALKDFKNDHPQIKLVKVYYIDEDNFVIKGIDENQQKCYTKRKAKSRYESAFDNNWRK